MSYKKKTIIAGKVKEVTYCHAARNSSTKRPRRKNENVTSEQQRKGNERRSYKTLYLLMNANFKEDDLYLTLTYNKNKEEPTPENAKKELDKLLKKLRYRYKKLGFAFKYIGITECKKKRIHHHLLINNIGISISNIKKLWNFGFVKMQIFAGEPEDCERLANYFVKESNNTFNTEDKVHGLRWISSKNLIHPVPKVETVPASTWRENIKPSKGYYIAIDIKGQTEQGYPYRFCRMIKIPGTEDEENN